MRLFGESEAAHYCASFLGSRGDAEKSLDEFQTQFLGGRRSTIGEGTPLFQEYRDCSLRDVERALFFAASHYRRFLDLMLLSSSPWAHVTMYYGSWYAAHALLGIFGCTVFKNRIVVDVSRGSPGRQELRIWKARQPNDTSYNGSHQVFWDLFYKAVQVLQPMVTPRLRVALTPVSRDPVWQIKQRNDVNYDSYVALRLAQDFGKSFCRDGFPACLPGVSGTQFRVFEALLEIVFSYAGQFRLRTDALDSLGSAGILRDKVRELVYNDRPLGLVRRTRKSLVT